MSAADYDGLAVKLDELAATYRKDSWFERAMRNYFSWCGRYYRGKGRKAAARERAGRGQG
jgi:hypothetical protein